MILSVSRRTDVPAFYADWFFERLRQGFVLVRNPMNPHRISRILLSPEHVDCIYFWSKDPSPMVSRLHLLQDYMTVFQFTLNAYSSDIEPHVPQLNARMETFCKLSDLLGSKRVIWRYDPILITEDYTVDFHCRMFEHIAQQLSGRVQQCVISFLDMYPTIQKSAQTHHFRSPTEEERQQLAKNLASAGKQYGFSVQTCAEQGDYSAFGIRHGKCIDPALVSRLLDCPVKPGKDPNQRPLCGCMPSVDIGAYNTCRHGCRYCYANHSTTLLNKNTTGYDILSPILCGRLCENDQITDRAMPSVLEKQTSLF